MVNSKSLVSIASCICLVTFTSGADVSTNKVNRVKIPEAEAVVSPVTDNEVTAVSPVTYNSTVFELEPVVVTADGWKVNAESNAVAIALAGIAKALLVNAGVELDSETLAIVKEALAEANASVENLSTVNTVEIASIVASMATAIAQATSGTSVISGTTVASASGVQQLASVTTGSSPTFQALSEQDSQLAQEIQALITAILNQDSSIGAMSSSAGVTNVLLASSAAPATITTTTDIDSLALATTVTQDSTSLLSDGTSLTVNTESATAATADSLESWVMTSSISPATASAISSSAFLSSMLGLSAGTSSTSAMIALTAQALTANGMSPAIAQAVAIADTSMNMAIASGLPLSNSAGLINALAVEVPTFANTNPIEFSRAWAIKIKAMNLAKKGKDTSALEKVYWKLLADAMQQQIEDELIEEAISNGTYDAEALRSKNEE